MKVNFLNFTDPKDHKFFLLTGGEFILKQDAVERILNNLLDNAFKYSPNDSEVEIKIRKQGEFVKISILDSGEGVPDEDQRSVFKRFYRTAAARANTQQGSGLGLAIVRNLVNNLQGEVGVDSRQGNGSEFWFTLPTS